MYFGQSRQHKATNGVIKYRLVSVVSIINTILVSGMYLYTIVLLKVNIIGCAKRSRDQKNWQSQLFRFSFFQCSSPGQLSTHLGRATILNWAGASIILSKIKKTLMEKQEFLCNPSNKKSKYCLDFDFENNRTFRMNFQNFFHFFPSKIISGIIDWHDWRISQPEKAGRAFRWSLF